MKVDQNKITEISKSFADGFKPDIPKISGSGWLIVDPLSAYLGCCGYKNTLTELPASDNNHQVLIMEFEDGSTFIPAGSDLPMEGSKDWMWI